MALTNEQVEKALSWEKRITETCKWVPRRNRLGMQLAATVGFLNQENHQWEIGQLRAVAYPGRSVSMALLYYGEPIRRLDNGKHANPDKVRFDGIHKHRWDEADGTRWAYKPPEFDDSSLISQPDAVFQLFLEECSIELQGSYQPFLLGS